MKRMRGLYNLLMQAAVAHAKWDYETSMNIVKSKRRLWILGLMVLPVILVSVAFAAGLPEILGGHKAYTPAYYTTTIFVVSILIGLCAGLITGCIGAGGGFIITPALTSAGVKGILAVGTDLFHIFAKAIMGTARITSYNVCYTKLLRVIGTMCIAIVARLIAAMISSLRNNFV